MDVLVGVRKHIGFREAAKGHRVSFGSGLGAGVTLASFATLRVSDLGLE